MCCRGAEEKRVQSYVCVCAVHGILAHSLPQLLASFIWLRRVCNGGIATASRHSV